MRVAVNGLFLAYPATGTGQYLRELVRALGSLEPDDRLTLIAPQPDPTAPGYLLVEPTRSTHPDLSKVEFEQLAFRRATLRGTYDLAHIPHFGSPLFPTRPSVVTIHDLIPVVMPTYRGSWRVQLYTRLVGNAARRANAILADSVSSANDIATHLKVPHEQIHVVHLAADGRYRPDISDDELNRVRQKYDLPERFVLYLGGFDVRKNLVRVLETFANSAEANRKNYKLVLAGPLPAVDSDFVPSPLRLAEQFELRDRVTCIGFVTEQDKPALYAQARAFLFPSVYEGFGLPPLEAMACGTPVIVSNRSSLPEVVGPAGILLDPNDAAAWRDALDLLLSDDVRWGELCAKGIEQASKFSWERVARETREVYRSVV